MRTQNRQPILLNAVSPVLTNTPNLEFGVTDMSQLRNPSRTPFLIDGIRFRLFISNKGVSNINFIPPSDLIGIGVKLYLGRMQLTAGRYIPIGLLCASLDSATEFGATAGGIGTFAAIQSGGNLQKSSSFTWMLPKPLFVPAGETLVPRFQLDGDFSFAWSTTAPNQSISLSVTYFGRAMPSDFKPPDLVNVPHADVWIDKLRNGGDPDSLAVRSTRSDLKNINAEKFYVQRMLGNIAYKNNANGTAIAPLMMGASVLDPANTNNASSSVDWAVNEKITARIFKSDGTKVAREATPWAHLFNSTTRTLDMCSMLKRNEYYQVQADIKTSGLPAGDKLKLMAAVVGYRKVAWGGGAYVEKQ